MKTCGDCPEYFSACPSLHVIGRCDIFEKTVSAMRDASNCPYYPDMVLELEEQAERVERGKIVTMKV